MIIPIYSKTQIEDALGLFKDVDMFDLGDFPEDQHQYIEGQFKILVGAGAARCLMANEVDYPITCDLNVCGKRWRDQIYRGR